MNRVLFDDDWSVLRGELPQPVARNTAKTGTAGLAADLTLAEGGKMPIPDHLIDKIPPALMEAARAEFRTVKGDWLTVSLPDDWTTRTPPDPPITALADQEKAAADPAVRAGYLPMGVAWYRKVFEVPAEWDGRRIRLDFDGVMRDAHVWVNGSFIGSHYSGYTGFSLDVTEFLRYGDEGRNVVLVRTDTTSQEGWWADGGGIYRHVWLVSTHPVHIARHGVFVATVALEGTALAAGRATLEIHTEIDNDSTDPVEVAVDHTVTTPTGAVIDVAGPTTSIAPLSRATVTERVTIDHAQLWSLSSPLLHHLHSELRVAGEAVDTHMNTFGIRTVEYGTDGLLLNGELTPINGVCCHQDFAGVGVAVPDRAHEYRIRRLQEIGCNAYRMAHHPPTPELLDACDRLGMLVLDENRRLETNEVGLADLAELIRRDRNHPSVFMWSLQNEEMIEGTPMAKRLLRRLVAVARELDPTRPNTIAAAFAKRDVEYMSIPDVAGINYDRGASGDYRAARPGAPVMATEDASFMSSRGVYADDRAAGLTSSYDEGGFFERIAKQGGVVLDLGTAGGALGTESATLESTEANRLAHPYIGGVFLWTGFDYRGEAAPFGWPSVNAAYGLLDYCGFPKDVAHYWRARWTTDPMVHVLPHWNWPGLDGQALRVVVYSNCDEVELFVNGTSITTVVVPVTGAVTAAVPYAPGRIEARGRRGGMVVTSTVRETTGAPAALRLSTDDSECRAGGHDVVIARVDVVDADGRVVPDSCPHLEFTCDGGATVLGSGNGSPADHVPAAEAARAAFNGHALVIARSPITPGSFTVTVTAAGLGSESLQFEAR